MLWATLPEEIAKTLQNKGIRGLRDCPSKCPIAEYLVSCGFIRPRVSEDDISVSVDEFMVSVKPTSAVAQFIRAFDLELFPAVAREPEDDEGECELGCGGCQIF